MATYTQILYHIVFATKARKKAFTSANRENLLKYIWGIIKNHNCHLYRINAYKDHVHILLSLHPSICLADLVREIKVNSSKWMKENRVFTKFDYWQESYGAFTYSITEKDRLIEYVKNQEKHHQNLSFIDEYKSLLREHKIEFDERYLT